MDADLTGDMPLFIDPYALSKRQDQWSVEASNLVVDFFEQAIDHIKRGEEVEAQSILSNLSEPNDTGLGFSKKGRRGRGVAGQLDLSPKLRQPVKSQNSMNGEFDSWEFQDERSRVK